MKAPGPGGARTSEERTLPPSCGLGRAPDIRAWAPFASVVPQRSVLSPPRGFPRCSVLCAHAQKSARERRRPASLKFVSHSTWHEVGAQQTCPGTHRVVR